MRECAFPAPWASNNLPIGYVTESFRFVTPVATAFPKWSVHVTEPSCNTAKNTGFDPSTATKAVSLTLALICLLLLQSKHLVADYPLQSASMIRNKGAYGHPGGLLHAGLHAGLTGAVLVVLCAGGGLVLAIPAIEFVLHYHIDWAKEVLSNRWLIGPKMVGFWHIHGIDQALHQATYVAVIWWVAT